jgi:hypothetical protein
MAGNLPAELNSFVGGRGELAEVRRLLADSRLVTLTGIGGVGKTRLAPRATAGLQRAFRDGVVAGPAGSGARSGAGGPGGRRGAGPAGPDRVCPAAARDACPGRSARAPGCPAPAACRARVRIPSLPLPAAAESRSLRDGMSRRPARGSRPAATRRGQRVQRNPEKRSDARGRRADRLRHGNGPVRRACAGAQPRDATGRAVCPAMSSSQSR